MNISPFRSAAVRPALRFKGSSELALPEGQQRYFKALKATGLPAETMVVTAGSATGRFSYTTAVYPKPQPDNAEEYSVLYNPDSRTSLLAKFDKEFSLKGVESIYGDALTSANRAQTLQDFQKFINEAKPVY